MQITFSAHTALPQRWRRQEEEVREQSISCVLWECREETDNAVPSSETRPSLSPDSCCAANPYPKGGRRGRDIPSRFPQSASEDKSRAIWRVFVIHFAFSNEDFFSISALIII